MADFSLTMVSHACIKAQAGKTGILCDPWLLNEPVYDFSTWKFPAARMTPEEALEGISHVFISHTHEDHFHIPSLDRLPRELTLLLPDYTWKPVPRAKLMERTMRALGFFNIVMLKPWETHDVGDGLSVTAVPAAPSKPQDWENSGLVIDHPEARLLNMNDTPSDEETYGELVRRYPHFDVILIQYAGVSIHPGRFRMPPDQLAEAVRTKRANFNEQERACRLLSFDHLVPFAGDFCWLDDRLYHCNWASRATPALFENWMNETFPEHRGKFTPMLPSDRWSPAGGHEHRHPGVDWENYLDEISALKKACQPKVDAINAWLAASSRANLRPRTKEYMGRLADWASRLKNIDFTATFRIFIEGDASNFSFVIGADPERGFRVSWDDALKTDQTFYVPEPYWAALLEAKVMFNLLPWPGEIDQHVPFRIDLAKFWWWLEYYSDFLNRNPQVVLERIQYPWLENPIRPNLGVFEI